MGRGMVERVLARSRGLSTGNPKVIVREQGPLIFSMNPTTQKADVFCQLSTRISLQGAVACPDATLDTISPPLTLSTHSSRITVTDPTRAHPQAMQ